MRTERKKERSAADTRRDYNPTPQEKEVEGQKEDEQKEDDLECELQLSPMDVDKVLVNGIELTKGIFGNSESSLFISRHFRQWL